MYSSGGRVFVAQLKSSMLEPAAKIMVIENLSIKRHIEGPFEYKGVIMDESPTDCRTNHHSILDYRGRWYLFYHHKDCCFK